MWESWRKEITGKRLFRCQACAWRGWAHDTGPKFDPRDIEVANAALAPNPPDLPNLKLAKLRRRMTPRDDVDTN